jgi:hypothetical protein
MRFEGTLNVDLNEVTMNLVPYPKMHFLLSSLTPLYSLYDVNVPPRLYVPLLLHGRVNNEYFGVINDNVIRELKC